MDRSVKSALPHTKDALPPPVPTIRRSAAPLRREVLEALRASIVNGRLAPGARLIERELIGMMGVSRTVIREALRQLEAEGLVDVVPNRGAIVRELTVDEARDLYAIRAARIWRRVFVKAGADEIAALGRGSRRPPPLIGTAIGRPSSPEPIIRGAVLRRQSETLSTMLATSWPASGAGARSACRIPVARRAAPSKSGGYKPS